MSSRGVLEALVAKIASAFFCAALSIFPKVCHADRRIVPKHEKLADG